MVSCVFCYRFYHSLEENEIKRSTLLSSSYRPFTIKGRSTNKTTVNEYTFFLRVLLHFGGFYAAYNYQHIGDNSNCYCHLSHLHILYCSFDVCCLARSHSFCHIIVFSEYIFALLYSYNVLTMTSLTRRVKTTIVVSTILFSVVFLSHDIIIL